MFCPYCRTELRPGATRCAACTSWLDGRAPAREWLRAREGKVLGGVARGLANRFAVPVAIVRVLFIVGVFLGLWTIPLYVALWIAMPMEPLPPLPPPPLERSEAIAAPPAT